jgi:hypothetical protein
MKTYSVVFETREPGAIGNFDKSGVTVEIHQSSFSESDVYREAMRQLHNLGLETRFPVSIEEVTE